MKGKMVFSTYTEVIFLPLSSHAWWQHSVLDHKVKRTSVQHLLSLILHWPMNLVKTAERLLTMNLTECLKIKLKMIYTFTCYLFVVMSLVCRQFLSRFRNIYPLCWRAKAKCSNYMQATVYLFKLSYKPYLTFWHRSKNVPQKCVISVKTAF